MDKNEIMQKQADARLMNELQSGQAQTFIRQDGVKMVAIPQQHFLSLVEDSEKLEALDNFGVDNWGGYTEAMQSLEEGDE